MADIHISVRNFPPTVFQRAPIDLFFRSLAGHHTDGAAYAIILTGAGADAAVGVKSIKKPSVSDKLPPK
jgi:two-component system CheB/CheR fusion protein